jgi:5-methylcytosine-specific restriction enzyme A
VPAALLRACVYGCPHDATACPEHGRKAQAKAYDLRRGTRQARGYDERWTRYTQWFRDELARHGIPPVCGARLPGTPPTQDSDCQREQRITQARVVDHITPVQGKDDPRFYDPTNHQLLCDGVTGRGCHDRKRQRERRP